MKAMLLAAGLGTRLRPLTYELPKPMVPILGRPVMEHILRLLARHGFDDVVANLHYFPDLIREHFGDGSRQGVSSSTRYEQELLGTAGGVRNVRDHFGGETFLIISGDALTDIDLTALWRGATRRRAASPRWRSSGWTTRASCGVVIVDDDGRIQGFQEKPDPAEALSNLGSCGIYMFEPEIFDYFPDAEFVDWAQDVYPGAAGAGRAASTATRSPSTGTTWGRSRSTARATSTRSRAGCRSRCAGSANGASLAERRGGRGVGVHRRGLRDRVRGAAHRPGRDRRALARIGEGAALRDTIVWPGTELDPGTVLIGAVAGRAPAGRRS